MQQQKSIKFTSGAIAWLIFVLATLLMPAKKLKSAPTIAIPGMDKIVHFILFAVLTFLIVKAIQERKRIFGAWKLFVILSLFGLSTEIAQHFIEDRNADVFDLLADNIGIGSILLIFKNHFR